MALQVNYTDVSTTLNLPTAYVVLGNSHSTLLRMEFDVYFWVNIDAFNLNKNPILSRIYSIPVSDVTGPDSLYSYLQTLPEFAGSTVVS